MQLLTYPEPETTPGLVKLKIKGFPDEELVLQALVKYYTSSPTSPSEFKLFNMFDELIFSGRKDAAGQIQLTSHSREEKKTESRPPREN